MKAVTRWTTCVAIALALSSTSMGMAFAAPATPPGGLPAQQPAQANSTLTSDELAALATAAKTGKPATIDSLTTEYSTTVANPSGDFTYTSSRVPQRIKRGNAWTPIDASLTTSADGRIRPSAALSDVSFSAGGTGPLAITANQGATVTVALTTPLPKPTLAGDTATYAEVFAGVDLQVTATATGYTQVWVVKNAQAATNPALKTLTSTIEVAGATATTQSDGSVVIGSVDKPVLTAGAPTAWDSTPSSSDKGSKPTAKNPGDGQRAIKPALAGKGSSKNKAGATATTYSQTLSVPDTMLANAQTVFPLFIDPGFDASRAHFTVVTNLGYTYSDNTDILRVGYCRFTGCYNFGNTQYYVARSYVSFDITALNQIHGGFRPTITSANINTHQTYNAASAATTLYLNAATGLPGGWPGSASTTLASATIAGDTYVNLGGTPVVSNLQGTINTGATSAVFAYTSDETISSGNNGWKKLANNPVLQVNYTYSPNTPTGFTVAASGCGGQQIVNTSYPLFKLSASDDQNRLQYVTIQIYSGNALVGQYSPGDTANGFFAYQWPTVVANGAYTARASATNQDNISSAWTPSISFTVANQPPPAPTISQPNTSGRSVLVTSTTEVAGFAFSWDTSSVPSISDPCSDNYGSSDSGYRVASRYVTANTLAGTSAAGGWAAEISVPASAANGPHMVYVKSYNAAGNTQSTPLSMQVTLTGTTTVTTELQSEALTTTLGGGLTASTYSVSTPGMNGSAVAYTPGTTPCPTLSTGVNVSSATCFIEFTVPVPAGAYNPAQWQIQIKGVVTSASAQAKFGLPAATFTIRNDGDGFLLGAKLLDASASNCVSPCSQVQSVPLATKTVGTGGSTGLVAGSSLKVRVYPTSNAPVVIDSITLVGTLVTTPTAGSFVPTSSVRLLDTRLPTPSPVPANSTTLVSIVGQAVDTGQVPSGATAAVVNLTVTQPLANGYLSAWASGRAWSGTSNVNFVTGQTVGNLAVVPIGTDGKIAILNASVGASHVVVDLVGYYAAGTPTITGAYQPLASPYRLNSANPVFIVPANGNVTVNPSTLSGGAVPLNATSLMISVAFIPNAVGVGSVQPAGTINYGVSNQNFVSPGNAVAALVSTSTTGGNIVLVNQSSQATGMVLDVLGYTISGTSNSGQIGMFVPITRMRAFDTRNLTTGVQAPLTEGKAILLRGAATNGATVSGLVTTATVTNSTADGYIATYPTNVQPAVGSALNFTTGSTIANLNITKASPQGTVSYRMTGAGSVDLIVDIAGYYTSGA